MCWKKCRKKEVFIANSTKRDNPLLFTKHSEIEIFVALKANIFGRDNIKKKPDGCVFAVNIEIVFCFVKQNSLV